MCICQRIKEPVVAVVSHSRFIQFNKNKKHLRKEENGSESIASLLKYAELSYKLTNPPKDTFLPRSLLLFCICPGCFKWIQLKIIAALNHPAPDKTNEPMSNKATTFLLSCVWHRDLTQHLANIYRQKLLWLVKTTKRNPTSSFRIQHLMLVASSRSSADINTTSN